MKGVQSNEQLRALAIYYSLGDSRTYKAVAEMLGKSVRTIRNWGTAFDWNARIAQAELEKAKQAGQEELRKATLPTRTKYRGLVGKLLEQAGKDILSGKLQLESVEDFETAVKLDLLLIGETTERIEKIE